MRVLIITGEGLDKAIQRLRERFKEAVDILSISYLDDLTTFYNQGYVFDKCIVLTPKRTIRDYTVDILEENLLDFKSNIEQHQTGIMQEIIFCVTDGTEGCIVAENTCDLTGMFYTIEVKSVSMGDLNSFVTLQGTALSQKYKTYDLASLRNLEIRKQKERKAEQSIFDTDEDEDDNGIAPSRLDEAFGFEDEGSLVGGISGLEDSTEADEASLYKKLDISDSFWDEGEDEGNEETDFFGSPVPKPNTSKENYEEDEDEDDFFTQPSRSLGTTGQTGGFSGLDTEEDDEPTQQQPECTAKNNSFFDTDSNYSDFESGFGSLDSTEETETDSSKESEEGNDFFSSSEGFSSGGFGFDTGIEEEADSKEELESEPVKEAPTPKLKHKTLPKATKETSAEVPKENTAQRVGLKRKIAKETPTTQAQADVSDTVAEEPKKKGLFGRKDKHEEVKKAAPVKKPVGGKLRRKGAEPVEEAPAQEETEEGGFGDLEDLEVRVSELNQATTGQTNTSQATVGLTQATTGLIFEDSTEDEDFEIDSTEIVEAPQRKAPEVDTTVLFEDTRQEVAKGKGAGLKGKNTVAQKVSAKDRATKKSAIPKDLKGKLDVYKKRGALLVFTGAPNTGKTLVSGNIANLLCKLGYSVAIVDLDTLYKGQSYLNSDCCDMVHSSHTNKQSVVSALNSTGTDFSRYLDVVRPGLHMLTTTLGSDSVRPEALINNKSFARLIHELIASYNFVIVDVGFQELKTTFRDFADSADSLVFVEEATTHGMTNFMLNLANIEDEAMQSLIFHRGSLVLNKEDGMNNFFGRKVDNTLSLLTAIDDLVFSIEGAEAEFKFADIRISGVVPYNKGFEAFWNNKKFISDTAEGEKLFISLLQNCL